VYLSTDGEVFTFHDTTLKRTAGIDKKCEEASWKDLVSTLDVGAWKGPQWKGTRPALLSEVLALARNGRYIYVEIKSGPRIVPYVKRVFERQSNATPANTLFISFKQDVCAELKRLMPEYKVYWLTGPHADANDTDRIIKTLKETGADGVDIHFKPEIVTKEYVSTIRNAGYEFHMWTIDTADLALKAFANGAQTVTTNRPKKLLAECQK